MRERVQRSGEEEQTPKQLFIVVVIMIAIWCAPSPCSCDESGQRWPLNRIDDADRANGLLDIVHPDDVCTVENCGRCGGQAPFQPPFQSRYLPNETLAGSTDEDRGPRLRNSRRRPSIWRLCSNVLPNPRPGSSITRSVFTPAAFASLRRSWKNRDMSPTTSS